MKLYYFEVEQLKDDVYCLTFINKEKIYFSLEMLDELNLFLDYLKAQAKKEKRVIYYILQGKEETGIFNLGGDLALFKELSEKKDLQKILNYGYKCIDLIYKNLHIYRHNVIGISFLNGEARGGGFEAALSFEHIVGLKNVKISLPEQIMGFFPGMGAFEMLSYKVGYIKTKKMIMNNTNFTTDILYDDGIIDALHNTKKEAFRGIFKYIHTIKRNPDVFFALKKMQERKDDISHEELKESVELWANVIYRLKPIHLRKIEKILSFQNRKVL